MYLEGSRACTRRLHGRRPRRLLFMANPALTRASNISFISSPLCFAFKFEPHCLLSLCLCSLCALTARVVWSQKASSSSLYICKKEDVKKKKKKKNWNLFNLFLARRQKIISLIIWFWRRQSESEYGWWEIIWYFFSPSSTYIYIMMVIGEAIN
jgi:hypothetical protein